MIIVVGVTVLLFHRLNQWGQHLDHPFVSHLSEQGLGVYKPLKFRDTQEQSALYRSATKEIVIIGRGGRRLFPKEPGADTSVGEVLRTKAQAGIKVVLLMSDQEGSESIVALREVLAASKASGAEIELLLLPYPPIIYGDIIDGGIFSGEFQPNTIRTQINYRPDQGNITDQLNISATGNLALSYRNSMLQMIMDSADNNLEMLVRQYNIHQNQFAEVFISTSPGELIDKITILEIKEINIKNPEKLRHISYELTLLKQILQIKFGVLKAKKEELLQLKQELFTINNSLWYIENKVRKLRSNRRFGADYIATTSLISSENEKRAEVKRKINELAAAKIVEEKEYYK